MKKLIITLLFVFGACSTMAQTQTDKAIALEKAKELCSTWSQAAGMIMTYCQAGYSASDNFKNFKKVVDSVAVVKTTQKHIV